MSAVLELTDVQPVMDLLEKLQNVQRAMTDLHDTQDEPHPPDEFSVTVTLPMIGRSDVPVANTHRLSYWVVMQGLAAMERELRQKLAAKEIEVESVAPFGEGA